MLALLNLLAILASGLAAPPDRGPWLAIRSGEFVTAEIHPDGGWRVLDRGPAEPENKVDKFFVGQVTGEVASGPKGETPPVETDDLIFLTDKDIEEAKGETPPAATANVVRFDLKPLAAGKGMLLVVTNGYQKRLSYRGYLWRQPANRMEATSVCAVLGSRHGYEHWPYPFAELDVGGFQLTEEANQDMECR
ncbi:MAG: hypothetical protein WA047_07965 [Phenylobacterium sp.]|uniref:hypothetical protein n=1 Tax=Phenylobacterium sp. TaxID=1871053 RepID=UPI003BB6B310